MIAIYWNSVRRKILDHFGVLYQIYTNTMIASTEKQ